MKNINFGNLPATAAARVEMIETVAEMKAKDRKYFEQACVNEWEEIESDAHQYMTLADVIRVKKILKI